MIIFIIFLLILFLNFIRVVPADAVVIIDRNTHYLKTKKWGPYFFIPTTDKITTEISKNKLKKTYTNNYETHDGKIVYVSFSLTYHTDNLETFLDALKSARRSVDDIACSSIYWALNDLNYNDFLYNKNILYNETFEKLSSEALELNLVIDNFTINNLASLANSPDIKIFKPHLSSHSSGPIKFN